MKISQSAVDYLQGIEWFKNLGQPSTLSNVVQLPSESAFLRSLEGNEWENLTLEAGNEITGCLAKKHSNEYQKWNPLVKDAKKIIETVIIPKIKFPNVGGGVLLDSFKWDIVNYLIEDTYKPLLRGPFFFAYILEVYEAGHMPCGWSGAWPSGKLVIY
ncbi:hypothetical protein [Cronobacter dublinensis]|uniref:hypothetical protein n=1 Tax=Cronobacter dublinensis TaxID=413497 RepID=UPI0013760724|nr:hypothetical protein [Cronobacter dublinensis]NCH73392.1 hypothetical protein [Cronobacter dublinensis]